MKQFLRLFSTGGCLLLLWFISLVPAAFSAGTTDVAMTAERWQTKGDVQFDRMEGFPQGIVRVRSGSAALKDVSFANGTIEFDIGLVGHGVVGIVFRRQGDDADVFFLRPSPDCPASDDCVQYMPLSHGIYQWDLFPEYQTQAPIRPEGWNHIRMVVSGKRMRVFVNDSARPTLAVDWLEGGADSGTIDLHGPASFANLKITPGQVDGLAPEPVEDPAVERDGRYLRSWSVLGPLTLPSRKYQLDPATKALTAVDPSYTQLPGASQPWQSLTAERKGLVNLTRRYGSSKDGSVISGAWLKTTVDSDRAQQKQVSIGWVREAWVFVNGTLVFAGKNTYGDPAHQREPDGRIGLENGTFMLPLRAGANEIAVLLDDNFAGGSQHFGWGLEMRLDDLAGVRPAEEDAR